MRPPGHHVHEQEQVLPSRSPHHQRCCPARLSHRASTPFQTTIQVMRKADTVRRTWCRACAMAQHPGGGAQPRLSSASTPPSPPTPTSTWSWSTRRGRPLSLLRALGGLSEGVARQYAANGAGAGVLHAQGTKKNTATSSPTTCSSPRTATSSSPILVGQEVGGIHSVVARWRCSGCIWRGICRGTRALQQIHGSPVPPVGRQSPLIHLSCPCPLRSFRSHSSHPPLLPQPLPHPQACPASA